MNTVELEAFLTPIPGELPCGRNLRDDSSARGAYFEMRDLRNDARLAERDAETPKSDDPAVDRPVDPAPKWRDLAALATTTLMVSAKDLEVAAWLIEAEVRARGLVALTEGARLVQGLVERFWDGLYPTPDEDGLQTRVAPLSGLNGQGGDGTLVLPLMRIPIFKRPDETLLALWEWLRSEGASKEPDAALRASRFPNTASYDDLLKEAALPAGRRQFAALREQADAACAAWAAASAALDAAAGRDRPPMGRIRDILLSIQALATAHGGPRAEEAPGPTGTAPSTDTLAPALSQAAAAGRTMTREDALRLLSEVAAFFRRTEPHSPLSYTLEEAVRRARMSLFDLLAEIVPDADQREGMLLRLGMRPPAAPGEE